MMMKRKNNKNLYLLLLLVLYVFLSSSSSSSSFVSSWEWSDFLSMGGGSSESSSPYNILPNTLTREEIKLMRVRDIKRILGRNHGYSPDELVKMLDKKELINALAYEENKIRTDKIAEIKRNTIKRGFVGTFIAVLVVFCWPLFKSAYEIGHVNLVVYTDRRKYEASKCMQYKSIAASIGFILMFVLDILQGWLTATVLLSWVIRRNKYFFPTPHLPVKPGQFMGKEVAGSAVGQYGINIGPMLVTWSMRFVHRYLESWTGRALVEAQRSQRRTERDNETPEQRTARRAARKEEKKKRAAEAEAASSSSVPPPSSMPTGWMEPATAAAVAADYTYDMPSHNKNNDINLPASATHSGFLQEIDAHNADTTVIKGVEFLQELDDDDDIDEPTGLDDLD